MTGTNFHKIPTVLHSQEILEKAFSRAARIEEPWAGSFVETVRKEVIDKVSTVETIERSHLEKLVKKFPSTDEIHAFYRDILDLMFSIDQYKISLSKLQKTAKKIAELATFSINAVKRAKQVKHMNSYLKQFYGRTSSLIKDLEKDLLFLSKCRDDMKKLPTIDTEITTFIIAGAPNVGKSSLTRKLTGSRTAVAVYPFTTQTIHLGFMEISGIRYQVIDTPGILDRPIEKRNAMEQQAILALKNINATIVFLFDYSDAAHQPAESQERLFKEIETAFGKPMMRVQSKADISESVEDIRISAVEGTGIDDLLHSMMKYVAEIENGN